MTQLIFDLYGTLIDIRTDEQSRTLWKTMSGWYADYGASYTPEQLREAYFRLCREEEEKLGGTWPEIELRTVFVRLLEEAPLHCPKTKQAEDESFAERTGDIFRRTSRRRFRLYPWTVRTLKTLKKQGHGIRLLSNAQTVFTVREMEETGLWPLFDAVYISSEYGIRKPDPRFMQALLDEQKLSAEECIMIGNDLYTDIRIADACGVRSVLFNTNGYSGEEIQTFAQCMHTQMQVITSLKELTAGEILCPNG